MGKVRKLGQYDDRHDIYLASRDLLGMIVEHGNVEAARRVLDELGACTTDEQWTELSDSVEKLIYLRS